jgi:pseudaminic acid cytidylyltransferase
MSDRIPCVIPARGGSRRFPRKNVAPLRGRPLLAWAVDAARASSVFSDVWVSTEDAEIAAVAAQLGAPIHPRPASLATDEATIVQVALDFAAWLEGQGARVEHLGIVLPTAVLVRGGDLRGAWEALSAREADGVMAVTTYLESPFQALEDVDGHLRLFFGAAHARQSQKLPPVVVDAGAFYLVRVAALRDEQTLYVGRLIGHAVPRERSLDIDEPVHLAIAEALMDVAARAPSSSLRLETPRAEHARIVWEWANDPVARANSFSSAPISWADHVRWWEDKRRDPSVRMWLMCDGDAPVGQIRYDRREPGTAEISIAVDPAARGHGVGTALLTRTAPLARRELAVSEVFGIVKANNAASIRAFTRAGYTRRDAGFVHGQPCYRFTHAAGMDA